MAGSPYDTLEEVIGLRGTPGIGSLADWGVGYRKVELAPSGSIDWEALATAVRPGGGWGCLPCLAGGGAGGRGGWEGWLPAGVSVLAAGQEYMCA